MTVKRVLAGWKGSAKVELGEPFERLVAAAKKSWLSDRLMVEAPGSDRKIPLSQQKSAGVHVLGRTGPGLFGVDREAAGSLSSRPVWFATFDLQGMEVVAPDLATFLTSHPSLEPVRDRMSALFPGADPQPAAAKPRPVTPPKRKMSPKAREDEALRITRRVLDALGRATVMVVDVEEGYHPSQPSLELLVQLPADLQGRFEHPFLEAVLQTVNASLVDVAPIEIDVVFASIHDGSPDAIARTRSVASALAKTDPLVLAKIDPPCGPSSSRSLL